MIIVGDCIAVMATLEADSVDAVICDPPYGIGFMNKGWDSPDGGWGYWAGSGKRQALSESQAFQVWCESWAREAFRVLKPGGHLAAFGGTRTYHRLTAGIEDAGFEIRDTLAWLYGSGFPKSLDVSKAIDKAAGAEREVVGMGAAACEHLARGEACPGHGDANGRYGETIHSPATRPGSQDAVAWQGWGTALKPAHEPITLARKPLRGTVAANVLEHGTGALNIGACRIEGGERPLRERRDAPELDATRNAYGDGLSGSRAVGETAQGRWPANVILGHADECRRVGTRTVKADGHHPAARGKGGLGTSGHAGQGDLSERSARGEVVEAWECVEDCPVRMLDAQAPNTGGGGFNGKGGAAFQGDVYNDTPHVDNARATGRLDANGGASRFFYTAKASSSERNAGLDGFEERMPDNAVDRAEQRERGGGRASLSTPRANVHPTVKPVDLMRWLVRLLVAPGGVVLDPFLGSGTTGIACVLEGAEFVGIEREAEYVAIAEARIAYATQRHARGLPLTDPDEVTERPLEGQLDLLGAIAEATEAPKGAP